MLIRYRFTKLVRDFIVKRSKFGKFITSYKKMNAIEFKEKLMEKFHEETLEVINAKSKKELIEEIGDCYEVIDSILKINKISKEQILQAQEEKRKKHGSFRKKCYNNYVECFEATEQHIWLENYINSQNNQQKYPILGKYKEHIVCFIVKDNEDKIYIQKDIKQNNWKLPGGKIEKNENFQDCIERELRNLDIKLDEILDVIYESNYIINNENYAYSVFEIKILDLEQFRLNNQNNVKFEMKWISENDINILCQKNNDNEIIYDAIKTFFSKK